MSSEQLDLLQVLADQADVEKGAGLPLRFDTGAVGAHARVRAFAAWAAEHGRLGCVPRSHMWHTDAHGIPGQPTPACEPVVLVADLWCWPPAPGHGRSSCSCVGGLVARAACAGCPWEGPVRAAENPAAEDALDHTHPGWRDLPLVPRWPEERAARAAWLARWAPQHPAGWAERHGPILTRRGPVGFRHVPGASPWGGCDVAADHVGAGS